MAEFVEKRCEDMIPELEHLEKLKIFDKNEMRGISKKLKEYEYKIQRTHKSKEDYLKFIQYEMDLFKLVRQRRDKLRLYQKKADIDHAIAKKINKLYKEAITRFQDDLRFWVAYIKFCKHFHYNQNVSQMIGRMLQIHQDKPKCWHIAALWEFEENKDKLSGRQYLFRGLQCHPDSQLLFTDIFKLELEEGLANKQDTEEENDNSQSIGAVDMPNELKRAYVVYRQAFKQIQDIKFIIQLLQITNEQSGTNKLQNKIVSDMIEEFPHEPLMWDTMARRELAGSTQPCGMDDQSDSNDTPIPSLRDRIESCNQVYQTAVKNIKTEEMWSLYLECLLEINQDVEALPNLKKKLLKNALSQMHQGKKMKEKYYLYWINMLSNDSKNNEAISTKLNEILCSATEYIPDSVNLWHARLKYLLLMERMEEANSVFNKATEILGEKGLSLWRMRLLHVQTNCPEKVEEIFQAAIEKNLAISKHMRPSYLEWMVLTKGINPARRLYNDLCLQPPFCIELHKKMALIETMQPDVSIKYARKPYEMAILHFGENHVDVWIDHILFEMKHGDPKKVGDIHRNAVKSLSSSLTDSFITEYSLIKANPDVINTI